MIQILDKSIPYYNVIMKRNSGTPIPNTLLPLGFSFITYQPGMEYNWAKVETAVGEFDNEFDAIEYFQREYMPNQSEISKRLIFVKAIHGELVATIICWWNYTGTRRDPSLHWVSVDPKYQGLGLGKAIIFEGLKRLCLIEGDQDVYLHTQTWSYKAIRIYCQAGFQIMKSGSFGHYINEYEEAITILRDRIT